jgi:hemerythrin-like metal-binding protein
MQAPIAWDPDDSVGHGLIDEQHQALLAHCNLLAEHCPPSGGAQHDGPFDLAFGQLVRLARTHFETETALLAEQGCAELEDHRFACDEFEVLVDEILTTEHFDRGELQRFLALWCAGHIRESAARVRAVLAGRGAAA